MNKYNILSYEERKTKVINKYNEIFNDSDIDLFSSPGRIEIIGNHTDHNNGLAMVSAVNLDILCAAKKRNDSTIYIISDGFEDININLDDLSLNENELGKSISIVRGILKRFSELGYNIGGFNAVLDSNIYKGAGLSSSAAYEALICKILSNYYNNDEIESIELSKISKWTENNYFGKPCGMLDQIGVTIGGINFVDFKSEENVLYKNITYSLDGYHIILVNTGGSHDNLTKYYSSIKNDMMDVSKFFNKPCLREVDEKSFYDNMDSVYTSLGGRAILRTMHFFDENKRVIDAYNSLKENNVNSFLRCINESGNSSYKLLQNCFIINDKNQELSFGIELSKKLINDGAVRVHGGGFKGTMLAFVSDKDLDMYLKTMKKVFKDKNVIEVSFRKVGAVKIENICKFLN